MRCRTEQQPVGSETRSDVGDEPWPVADRNVLEDIEQRYQVVAPIGKRFETTWQKCGPGCATAGRCDRRPAEVDADNGPVTSEIVRQRPRPAADVGDPEVPPTIQQLTNQELESFMTRIWVKPIPLACNKREVL